MLVRNRTWNNTGASLLCRCDHCGVSFARKRANRTGSHDFCSRSCAMFYRAKRAAAARAGTRA